VTAVTADQLGLIGIAWKARRLAAGEDPVGEACRDHSARLVLVASDAAENSANRAEKFTGNGKIPCVTVHCTKEELGRALGRKSCAMVALTDRGLAATLMTKLAETDPEEYGGYAETLNAAAARELSRRKEEKTRAQKARKPWVAPPKPSGSPKAKKSNGGGLIEPD
jgi:ribosomal protein L7Ae-like RNA K-turn-binding protein